MRLTSRRTLPARQLLGGLVTAMLLASCGGGTQVERFAPTRQVSLGDESSLINPDGGKYTVNATVSSTDATLVCGNNPVWVQVLAGAYGFVFAQCNPGAAAVTAVTHAVLGAKVADIPAQAALLGTLTGSELITVLAGANDIIAQYKRYPGVGVDQLYAELESAGASLAAQVNAIADAGGKVLIATVPDLGLTPYALDQRAGNTDVDRAVLLTQLTARFNAKLRANINNDGRRIGLLLADEMVQTIVKFPATYAFLNVTAAACLNATEVPATTCTSYTLQPATADALAAGANTWLWADKLQLSPGGHNRLGALAATRAAGNPF